MLLVNNAGYTMKRPPYLGLAIAAGIILVISLLAFRRYMPYVGSTLAPAQAPSIVLDMRNASFVGLNHSKKIWSVKAKRVQIGQDRSSTTLTGITEGKIFDKGKPVLQMQAGRAQYNSMVGDLAMDRGIKLTGFNGQKLAADGASWNAATSTLRSNGKVHYESKSAKASSDKVLLDANKKELTMWNVHAAVDISKQEAGQNGF